MPPTHVAQALVCPVLVGRAAEVAAVEAALDAVAGGKSGTLLLAGEAGVGKSRLVAAARAGAVARGMAVAQGVCFEPDRSAPYAPLLDLLREVGDAPLPAGGRERRLVFEAVGAALTRMADGRPLLVVLEDLHWADEASLELLVQLARRPPVAMLLLLTYRPGRWRFRLGDRTVDVEAGAFVFVPRGEVHTFQNTGTAPAEVLVLYTPAGPEGAFAAALRVPREELTRERAFALGMEFDTEIVGPPLEAPGGRDP